MHGNMCQLVVKAVANGTSIDESINLGERVGRKSTECCNAPIQETRTGKLPIEKQLAPKVLS